jgi:serine/threonine protein kinase
VFEGEIGPAADLWSLGLLVHECAARRSPFRLPSSDPEAIARVLRETEPKLDPALGEPFATIVRGCLQRDPTARWTSAQVRSALAATDVAPRARRRWWASLRQLLDR